MSEENPDPRQRCLGCANEIDKGDESDRPGPWHAECAPYVDTSRSSAVSTRSDVSVLPVDRVHSSEEVRAGVCFLWNCDLPCPGHCPSGDRMHVTDNPEGGPCSACVAYADEQRREFEDDQMDGLRESTQRYIG